MSIFDVAAARRRTRALRLRTGWIGVDIGSTAIKLAQVRRIAGQFRIVRSLILRPQNNRPFDASALEDGSIGHEIREAICVHGGFEGRLAACTLSMKACELRTLSTALGTPDEQRELITIELDSDVFASPTQREFDFWEPATQDRESGTGMTQVYVLTIPRSLSDSLAANMLSAGLRCQVLDAVPFSGLRAVGMTSAAVHRTGTSEKPVAVLDWGYSTATLVVIADDRPALTRCLRKCSLRLLLETVGQRLKLSIPESEALVATYGVHHLTERASGDNELRTIMTELVGEATKTLVDELNETFSFLRMQFAELMPAHLWLTGGGAGIPNIAEGLQAQINLPTTTWHLQGQFASPEHPSCILANAAALSALAWEA